MRLECASCGQLFVDQEMFDALGSCFACGATGIVEMDECEVCGAAFPLGRSCPVCAGTRASLTAPPANSRPVDGEMDVDAFLARIRAEPASPLPVRGYQKPARAPRQAATIMDEPAEDDEPTPERVLPPTRRFQEPLLSRDERLPTPELLHLLRDEGRALVQ